MEAAAAVAVAMIHVEEVLMLEAAAVVTTIREVESPAVVPQAATKTVGAPHSKVEITVEEVSCDRICLFFKTLRFLTTVLFCGCRPLSLCFTRWIWGP